MPSRNRTFFIAILLAVGVSFFRAQMMVEPIKSDNDNKQYQYMELDNQLKVVLVSDPTADHGAASLDVNVGSLQDPQLRPGLAHFLEHMLFLGTKSYPVAGEYQSFISQHGGRHNAYTSSEHTNYFFQIDGSQLQGALDRFSRFFYEPLFTEEYVQREKEAVHSEFKSKFKDDYRRIHYVQKALMNPAHPASHFATGNLSTLSDNDSSAVRDDLLAFYERYYSANLMTLTVYGPQDLKTLKNWVETLFNPIQNQNTTLDAYPDTLFEQLPLDVSIQPVKEILSLSFAFPLNQPVNYYQQKPTHYIGHLLGHEGEGSVLAWLKQQGWAEGLSAGLQSDIRNNGIFQVNISLTQTGLQNVDAISAQLFAYIQLIQQSGVQSWVFDEIKQLSNLQFTFQEGQEPSDLVTSISTNLHEYPAKEVLRGPYLWEKFDPNLIQSMLAKLTPDNTVRTLIAPSVQGEQIETWFNAPYNKAPLAAEKVTAWQQAKLATGLHIPYANPFVPQDISLLASSEQTLPSQIINEDGLSVWHLQDVSFAGPQSSIFISLESPIVQSSATEQVLMEAWVNLLNDHLNSFSYPAMLAGQNYSLYAHMNGLGIRLYGYRDKQDVLLNKILTEVQQFKANQSQWQQTQQELVRAFQNALRQKPFERSISQLKQTLLTPSFTEQQMLQAIEKAQLSDVLAMQAAFLEKLNIQMLGHGNISEKQLTQTAQDLKTQLLKQPIPQVSKRQVVQLAEGQIQETIKADHDDSAMLFYIQAQQDDLQERATIGLLAQILKAPYYTYMRTERKFGYIVFATPFTMMEQGGLAFIVQSPTTGSKVLMDESLAFLSGFRTSLAQLSDADFIAHQQGLINNLLKKPINLSEKSNIFWKDLENDKLEFNTLTVLADHIGKLSKDDLLAYFDQYVVGVDAKTILLTYDGNALKK